MSNYIIEGGYQLEGEIDISGSKNAALPIIAASLLNKGIVELKNCPQIHDVKIMFNILEKLGCKVNINNSKIIIDTKDLNNCEIPEDLMHEMRSSVIIVGALLGRLGKCKFTYPGGCEIGARPINMHLYGFEQLGVNILENGGVIECECGKLLGTEIVLDFPSVGATENIMLASVFAEGITRIQNAAQEPEIVDLANFLNMAGADISGAGSSEIVINGVKKGSLRGIDYSTIPDRIEAASYICAVCAAGGDVVFQNIVPSHLTFFLNKMQEIGVQIETLAPNTIRVVKNKILKSTDLVTQPHPGFHTDMQAPVMSVLALADGISIITENLFENRFMQVPELRRMGANIQQENSKAIIKGVEFLTGAEVKASDLRAGAALVIAALAAKGVSVISNIHHIDRGYEKLEEKLSNIGANIKRVEINQNLSDNQVINPKVLS